MTTLDTCPHGYKNDWLCGQCLSSGVKPVAKKATNSLEQTLQEVARVTIEMRNCANCITIAQDKDLMYCTKHALILGNLLSKYLDPKDI